MADPGLLRKLDDPTGRLPKLMRSTMTDDEVLDELFLAAQSRLSTADERQAFVAYRLRVADRRAAFTDALWALINTREFLFNN
jgi:hypothetical protein